MNFKVTRKQVKQKYDETYNYFKKTLELMAQATCEEDLGKVRELLQVSVDLQNKLEVLRKYLSASEILMNEAEFEKFNS